MGATATMLATQRALATRERLIDDPFAEPLVHAVDNDYFNRLVDGEIDLAELDPEFSVRGPPRAWRCAPVSSTACSPTPPRRAFVRR